MSTVRSALVPTFLGRRWALKVGLAIAVVLLIVQGRGTSM